MEEMKAGLGFEALLVVDYVRMWTLMGRPLGKSTNGKTRALSGSANFQWKFNTRW